MACRAKRGPGQTTSCRANCQLALAQIGELMIAGGQLCVGIRLIVTETEGISCRRRFLKSQKKTHLEFTSQKTNRLFFYGNDNVVNSYSVMIRNKTALTAIFTNTD